MNRGKFIAGNIHVAILNKEERSQTNKIIFNSKVLIKAAN